MKVKKGVSGGGPSVTGAHVHLGREWRLSQALGRYAGYVNQIRSHDTLLYGPKQRGLMILVAADEDIRAMRQSKWLPADRTGE